VGSDALFDLEAIADLAPDVVAQARQANETYAKLQQRFTELEEGSERLLVIPGMAIPTLSVPYELATVHVLRAIELARAVAHSIQTNNQVAAFPTLRSLVESWLVIGYATIRFQALAIDRAKWKRFDEIAMRLLLGNTSDDRYAVIEIGHMLATVRKAIEEEGTEESAQFSGFIHEWYGWLSNGTHPTQWSVTMHSQPRADGLGIHWANMPDRAGLAALIGDLEFGLFLLDRQLDELFAVAEAVRRSNSSAGWYRHLDRLGSRRRLTGSRWRGPKL